MYWVASGVKPWFLATGQRKATGNEGQCGMVWGWGEPFGVGWRCELERLGEELRKQRKSHLPHWRPVNTRKGERKSSHTIFQKKTAGKDKRSGNQRKRGSVVRSFEFGAGHPIGGGSRKDACKRGGNKPLQKKNGLGT